MFDYQMRGHRDIEPLDWSSLLNNSFTGVKIGTKPGDEDGDRHFFPSSADIFELK